MGVFKCPSSLNAKDIGPDQNHRTGMNRNRTGMGQIDRFVDRYRDEPVRNYRGEYLVPFCPTIYLDGTEMDRNGTGRDDTYFKK
ncbi:hypothetical protein H5410_052381 [Solanum commersonii]|uniref:Uncharacterized protein n=1 Tax=Solanum commersonii TaxID=4109 RepID=A0A9J5X1A8_SOLCO|nr:hypothetical protein H5410_052381 [Solanum commersonii]